MRLEGSVHQINLLSLFFLLNFNFFISTRIAKLAPVLTRQNSIRVQGIFFGVFSIIVTNITFNITIVIFIIMIRRMTYQLQQILYIFFYFNAKTIVFF